ncbi:MAG TPA: hypothetical protein VJU80_12780, partial [Solirubrobacteraceae bacterium]|nr:hypothetical protein [Solirubrobacteraceae bacterium]
MLVSVVAALACALAITGTAMAKPTARPGHHPRAQKCRVKHSTRRPAKRCRRQVKRHGTRSAAHPTSA